MADLSITVGGDTSELERDLQTVERQLQTLERRREARVRIGADVGDLDRRITQTNASLTRLRGSLSQTGAAAQNFNRQTANGSNTLTQFSRIAQDAPFGIMGIGNNLTATAEAFANLSRNAGGAGGALRAVGQSLLGGGGILLAISLITTGLTVMAQKGLTVGDVFDKLTGKFDETAKALKDINKEAVKSSGEEISTVKAYLSVAKDRALSDEKRLLAVKKLQDEYPAYFGNLSQEQILNGKVANAVDDLSRALRARATATAIAGKLGEIAVKRLDLEEKREQAILDIKNAQAQVAKQRNGDGSILINEQGVLEATVRVYKEIVKELKELDATSKRFSDRENSATKDSILLLKEKSKAAKKVYDTPQVTGLDVSITQSGLEGLVSLSGMVTQISKDVRGAEGVIATSLTNIPNYFNTSGQKSLEILQKFNSDMNKIISGGIVDTLAGLADAVGNAFATGGNVLTAVGKSLLSTLGGILSELGKMCITTGIGILAIQTALKSLNPYVAIAAGAALIALGGAVKGGVKKLGGSGGGSTGADTSYSTGASYSSPSSGVSSAGSSTSNSGTVVFEISGTSLIGVLGNTYDKNNRLGGSVSI